MGNSANGSYPDKHDCFVPCDRQVNPADAMDIRPMAKCCECGATVERLK